MGEGNARPYGRYNLHIILHSSSQIVQVHQYYITFSEIPLIHNF